MDPVTMATVAAVATAAGTAVSAVGQHQAAQAQSNAERQRAAVQTQWAQRRADEERTAAQAVASEERRRADLAQSRLLAVAGGSGGTASDGTVMDLWGDIAKEGDVNAGRAMAAGEQKGAGLEYQAALDQWGAESNARIRNSAARTSLISGLIGAGGQLAGGMSRRYPTRSGGYSGYYG